MLQRPGPGLMEVLGVLRTGKQVNQITITRGMNRDYLYFRMKWANGVITNRILSTDISVIMFCEYFPMSFLEYFFINVIPKNKEEVLIHNP